MSEPTCWELLKRCEQEAGEGPVQQSGLILATRVERVLELHRANRNGFCQHCGEDYPCPTVRLLEGEKLP